MILCKFLHGDLYGACPSSWSTAVLYKLLRLRYYLDQGH